MFSLYNPSLPVHLQLLLHFFAPKFWLFLQFLTWTTKLQVLKVNNQTLVFALSRLCYQPHFFPLEQKCIFTEWLRLRFEFLQLDVCVQKLGDTNCWDSVKESNQTITNTTSFLHVCLGKCCSPRPVVLPLNQSSSIISQSNQATSDNPTNNSFLD